MGEKEKKIDEIGALRKSRHAASLTEANRSYTGKCRFCKGLWARWISENVDRTFYPRIGIPALQAFMWVELRESG